MGLLQHVTAFTFLGLFIIAIIGFGTNFAIDNNAAIDLADDSQINTLKTNVEGNTSGFSEESENTYQSIVESSIDEGQTTQSGGFFAISPPGIVSSTKNVLQVGYVKIFGTGGGFGIFLTTFLSLTAFIFAMYIWKAWAGRIPD